MMKSVPRTCHAPGLFHHDGFFMPTAHFVGTSVRAADNKYFTTSLVDRTCWHLHAGWIAMQGMVNA
jgi:hypothetical protein